LSFWIFATAMDSLISGVFAGFVFKALRRIKTGGQELNHFLLPGDVHTFIWAGWRVQINCHLSD
jgi:hypothetical protein